MNPETVKDVAGRDVDCSGPIWRLNTAGAPFVLDWHKLARLPESVRNAARTYAQYRIPLWAPPSLGGLFRMYQLLARCPCFDGVFDGIVTMRAFEELRSDPRVSVPQLTRYRAWYRWAAILELPGFDPDVAGVLEAITIRKNSGNRPARKKGLEKGPLTDGERDELLNKTLDASDEELPLTERVAVLLSMGLGPNSGPLSLLQVGDYSVRTSGGTSYHLLQVPRHKKRLAKERAAFRPRQIERSWAKHLERLIELNRATANEVCGQQRPEGVAIPIFMRSRPRTDLQPAMREYLLHLTPREFSRLLQNAADRLGATSRLGEELRLNARRLRSTFATNLIADGKPKRVVADALDHLTTKTVDHYEFEDYRLAGSLDTGVGDAMQVVAEAFLGKKLADKSSEAARGRPPSSRIPFFDKERERGEDLGNCGSDGACRRAAPLACYSCREFEPWIDAPHERLLASLKEDRDRRRSAGMHPRIVGLQDRSIQAISEVVETIQIAKGLGTQAP